MNGYDQEYMYAHPGSAISGRGPVEWHHAIYRRNKNIPELNAPENLLPLTHDEHVEFHEQGRSGKCRAWLMKCEEFGHDHMVAWNESLPMICKENFE